MSKVKNDYFNEWRKKNPNQWNFTQLRWYHKNKKSLLLGQKKLKSEEFEEYSKYEESKLMREIKRTLLKIDKASKGWQVAI